MAITIHQQPDTHSAISTPLIVTASSTNSSNDGFKYVVRIAYAGAGGVNEYIVSPNTNGYLVSDLVPMIRRYIKNLPQLKESGTLQGSVHSEYNSSSIALNEIIDAYAYAASVMIECRILEGYNVDGDFTINTGSEVVVNSASGGTMVYNYLDFNTRNGFNPSLIAQIGHEDGDQSRIMSDRLPTTYDWPAARFVGLSQPNAIYIPAREADHGQWSVRGVLTGVCEEPTKVRVSILPNIGAPVQQVFTINEADVMSHLPLWPANMNASTLPDMPKPEDYPNWKAIYFQILNDANEQVSMNYVMFNVDHPQFGECSCHGYEVVRLAWVGRRGGWEYYNFTMLSETEYETDQKVAKKIVGNYGEVGSGVDFTFNSFDESEFVTYKKINKFVTCNTDILQPGEWEFLKGLILSKQVHWVHDDGTHTPVIIQDSNFKVRNPKSKAREALTVRFKVAQDQSN